MRFRQEEGRERRWGSCEGARFDVEVLLEGLGEAITRRLKGLKAGLDGRGRVTVKAMTKGVSGVTKRDLPRSKAAKNRAKDGKSKTNERSRKRSKAGQLQRIQKMARKLRRGAIAAAYILWVAITSIDVAVAHIGHRTNGDRELFLIFDRRSQISDPRSQIYDPRECHAMPTHLCHLIVVRFHMLLFKLTVFSSSQANFATSNSRAVMYCMLHTHVVAQGNSQICSVDEASPERIRTVAETGTGRCEFEPPLNEVFEPSRFSIYGERSYGPSDG